jgi:anaerobic magnesium-protoporphyrin IX monomethyl ester cyclase
MTKILFLQDVLFDYMGPMQLSAILKNNGHETDLLVWEEEKDFMNKVKEINPDLIAFSTMSGGHKAAIEKAREIKKELKVITVFGGAHPTFFPEMINEEGVDIICRGEADYTLLELAEYINQGKDFTKLNGFWVKKDNKVYKNPVGKLVENLDELPFLDRELYYKRYKLLRDLPVRRFMTGRGCVYNCSFCYVHKMREMYKGKVYARKRSVSHVVEEIKAVQKKYSLKNVRISDDTFTTYPKWLKEFTTAIKKEIGVPFSCLARANELNEEIIKALKEGGCSCLFFGVESGNEQLRNMILNKNLKDDKIINAARLLKKYKLKFGTYNMFGMPTETLKDAIQTIKLNIKLKPDYPFSTIFQPYPGTNISKFAQEQGVLPKDFSIDDLHLMHSGENPLIIENKKEITNLQSLAWLVIKFPRLQPLVKHMIKLPPNKVFKLIEKFGAGWSRMFFFGTGFKDTLSLAWKLRNKL